MNWDLKFEKASAVVKPFQAEGTTGIKSQGLADSKNREKLGKSLVRKVSKGPQRRERVSQSWAGPFCHVSHAKKMNFIFA